LVAQHRVLPARLSSLANGLGLGGFFGGYLYNVFSLQDAVWYMPFLPIAIGIFAAATARGERAAQARQGYRWFVLQRSVQWVGLELIRSMIPLLGTWGFLAYSCYRLPWLIQPVSVFGVFGLSFLIVATNHSVALLVLAVFDTCVVLDDERVAVKPVLALRWVGVTFGVVIVWVATSLWLLDTAPASLRVAALQPGLVAESLRAKPDEYQRAALQKLKDQTRDAAARGARLIVWPESMLSFDPQVERRDELGSLARETNTFLFVGYAVDTPAGQRNEVAAFSPEGTLIGVYGKDHPVRFLNETSITRGAYPVYQTPIGRLGSIICHDMDFTDTTRKAAANGAQLIAAPSWDWPGIAAKHFSHAVMRAVEQRVVLVKADYGFDSAIIDPWGRILESVVSPSGREAILVADVPVVSSGTILTSLGDWVGWLCVVALVARAIGARLRSTRPSRVRP
jgi:apolipoprotein N-acyltransferase